MLLSPIYTILGDILFPLNIIVISESVPSKNRVGRLLEIAGLVYFGPKKLTCQYPVGRRVPGMARRFSSHIEKMTTIETIAK